MGEVYSYGLKDNFMEKLAKHIIALSPDSRDYSNITCVFTGHRQGQFLKREIFKKLQEDYFPPKLIAMDDLVGQILENSGSYRKMTELDACRIIFGLCKDIAPSLSKGRGSFSHFLPWARQIISFIEKLDLEDISSDVLKGVSISASIGYEVPKPVNEILKEIILLRKRFHAEMEEKQMYSRGYLYLKASREVKDLKIENKNKILFCNFFYLQKTETDIIKHFFADGQADLFFQGSQKEWSVLADMAKQFSCIIEPHEDAAVNKEFKLYSGFDRTSQACIAREVLKSVKDKSDTVILLPDDDTLLPLMSEISSVADDFNTSAGMPIAKTSLYSLFKLIFEAQLKKKEKGYYSKDYINVLLHPLVKNLDLGFGAQTTRILVHKIEEMLSGGIRNDYGGSIFINASEIEKIKILFITTLDTLEGMGVEIKRQGLKDLITELNKIFFADWEEIGDFKEFCFAMKNVIKVLTEKSYMYSYKLNLTVADKLYKLIDELELSLFAEEKFPIEEIFRIFEQITDSQTVKFKGTPLKGLQVLGLFDTHSISFKNVIALDMNEGMLPQVKMFEALIPRDIMLSLGLRRVEKEEEIQRYQIMRLISSAQNVHLIYKDDGKTSRSRYIEELVWAKEKAAGKTGMIKPLCGRFASGQGGSKSEVKKDDNIIRVMNALSFSPTSVDMYMNCPMQFYFKYVLKLSEKQQVQQNVEAMDIGNFIHKLLEETYKRFIGRKPVFEKLFEASFFEQMEDMFKNELTKRMRSDSFMIKEIFKVRLKEFLEKEKQRPIEKVLYLEQWMKKELAIGDRKCLFGLKIDRIDQMSEGELLIIDYKTGATTSIPTKKEEKLSVLDDRESIKSAIKSFQLPIYLQMIKEKAEELGLPDLPVNATLYNIRDMEMSLLFKDEDLKQRNELLGHYMIILEKLLDEIYDIKVPFVADKDEKFCNNCPYYYACR